MLSRLSIRFRSALAAALTTALAFTAGACWLHHELYVSGMFTARERARATLDAVVSRYGRGTSNDPALPGPTAVFSNPSEMWVLVDSAGRFIDGNASLKPFIPGQLGPRAGPRDFVELPAGLGPVPGEALSGTNRLAGHTFTVMTATFASANPPDIQGEQLTLHVLITPWDAEQAVASADHTLFVGIPIAVLLVAVIVWTTASRALRPVEKIQQRLHAITAHNLSLRVPVPPRRDEIARLATTTNDALDRLERAVEQQRRFTADASHELRTPLAALHADLEVGLHYPERTDWPKVVRDVLGDAERLQQLTEDLLLLADLDHRGPPPTRPVSLTKVARQAAMLARRRSRETVRVDCYTLGSTIVLGDARQLERLLRNLLDNALHHANTLITVAVIAGPATVRIEVHDDGPGVPAEHREKIFERFTRLDASRDRTTGGTGLGLAIAREIAHRHGGTLTHPDTPQTTGARFITELPLAPSESTPACPPSRPSQPTDHTNGRM